MPSNVAILGAGIIGSAVAYELSRRGVSDIHVLDVDLEGAFSSSERNAGGVRHLWQQPINSELSRLSISLFRKIATEVGFQEKGYLWLFSPEKSERGEEVLRHAKERGLAYDRLSVSDVRSRYPFIDKTDGIAFGVFGSKDGILNSNGVKQYFRNEAIKHGVKFLDRRWVSALSSSSKNVNLEVSRVADSEVESYLKNPATHEGKRETLSFEKVIVTGGAWSEELFKPYFKNPVTRPIRRQMSFFKADDFDMSPYGMVVDTSGVYFHPEGGNMLAGVVLKNEPSGYSFDYDADFFESHIWPPLYERSSYFERLKHISGWGGLYSYTADITGILGEVPGLPHVYEAHSFTGHGVMHSYGAAVLLAEKIIDGKYTTLPGEKLSRERLIKNDPSLLLDESLHI